MAEQTQKHDDTAAGTAAMLMRSLDPYAREWLIHVGEQEGKVFDMRAVWRGGHEARIQEGIFG